MTVKKTIVEGGENTISPSDTERILELKELITKYDTQYYEEGVSEISDAEYDRLYNEYLTFEQKYPNLASQKDAPTKKVGAGAISGSTTGLPKFTHKSPLLSIDRKGNSLEDVKKWYDSLGEENIEVIVEPKLDGITCNLNYEDGILVNAVTRGNGYIGDVITENFKATDTTYPDNISKNTTLEIRGEAIIPYDYFKKNLENEYSNPRNAVAGIMRQLDSSEVKGKGVQVMFYDYGLTGNQTLSSEDYFDVRRMRNSLGFQNVPIYRCTSWESLKNVIESRMDNLIKEVDGFNVLVDEDGLYPQAVCDGLVIKVNKRNKREDIGFSEKGPKWAFAFKFKPLQAETNIQSIEWQVGRSGKLTPVAVFSPISLGGTTITRATLNNYDYMQSLKVLGQWVYDSRYHKHIYYPYPQPAESFSLIEEGMLLQDLKYEKKKKNQEFIRVKKLNKTNKTIYINDEECYHYEKDRYMIVNDFGLRVDDKIIVERANDVIPRIVAIKHRDARVTLGSWEETNKYQIDKKTFSKPSVCPTCDSKLQEIGANLFCMNGSCNDRLIASVIHYCSRDAMDIRGMGQAVVELFTSADLRYITRLSDIYSLREHTEDMVKLNRMGDKKVDNLLDAIDASKKCKLWQFIYGLGIEGCGKKLSKDLASTYHSLDKIMTASIDELLKIEGVSDITANIIHAYFSSAENQEEIKKLLDAGITLEEIELNGTSLKGMTFVITGTLEHSRSYYQEIIEKNGGKITGTVSKKTNVVLIGSDAGSKEEKARALVGKGEKISILDTEEKIKDFLGS